MSSNDELVEYRGFVFCANQVEGAAGVDLVDAIDEELAAVAARFGGRLAERSGRLRPFFLINDHGYCGV